MYHNIVIVQATKSYHLKNSRNNSNKARFRDFTE